MSGGIARGRLAEERKAWRKNHPHVRAPQFPPHPLILLCSRRVARWPGCLICSILLLCAGFRREAGVAARRDGEPDDLAVHHPRQARGKRPEP
jgi:hypothetical protein